MKKTNTQQAERSQAERLTDFFKRSEKKMFAKAASIYTTSELDFDNMSNLDALSFVLVRTALCKQYVANERHTIALTYGCSELVESQAAEIQKQRREVEKLWARLERNDFDWPEAWRA